MTQTANTGSSPRQSAGGDSFGRRLAEWLQEKASMLRYLALHPGVITTIGTAFRADPSIGVSAPWWNQSALRYFDAQVKSGDRVFEWGSGGSTAWLLSRGARVVSVEHEAEWVEKVKSRYPGADIRAIPATATGKIRETFFQGEPGERDRRFFDDYVTAIDEFPDDSFDVVIVDGMCRVDCFHRALPKVRPGGLIVVDDTDMKPFRSLRKAVPGWKTVALAGFKATKDLRETTFFHRPA